MCTTSRVSFFARKHDNPLLLYGILAQLLLCIIFVYVPGLQTALNSGDVGYPGWICLGISGVVIVAFNEWRKRYMQKNPGTRLTRELLW
jgi:hypothetical protein